MDKICRGILSYRQKWKDTMVQQFKEVGTCGFKTKALCKKKKLSKLGRKFYFTNCPIWFKLRDFLDPSIAMMANVFRGQKYA